MKSLKDMPLHKVITIVSLPFLYLFNLILIVAGIAISYHSVVNAQLLNLLFTIPIMIILPTIMMIINNPKKVWQAINNPIDNSKNKKE